MILLSDQIMLCCGSGGMVDLVLSARTNFNPELIDNTELIEHVYKNICQLYYYMYFPAKIDI